MQRFRWWQVPGRALFHLRLIGVDGELTEYAVDLRHWGNQSSGETKAHLYREGRHHAQSTIPAAFGVEGGTIEVSMSNFGMKRCHYVTDGGVERQLIPDPRSAEGRRARLDRNHPSLSRGIGAVAVIMLLIGVVLLALQLAEPISQIPPVAERIGPWESPLHLPLWLNITLGVGAALASMERALRLRFSWLDTLGN
ncbi:hypothetical protein ACQBAR_04250 [Propionibacteriaceae bacterium Y1685]|uniref:hypothetical protein n=1 Tax=Microlunatus sp. Y1700 TaxID=3418487 RepID=UPI003B7730AE